MTGKVFRAIVKQIKDLPNLETVCPYNHGEPLLDPQIFNRIRYIKKQIPSVRIELSTNGILLPTAFNKFCALVDDRWISFHGISKESYEKNMGISWEVGEKVRELIQSSHDKKFVISTGLIGFLKEEVEEYWKGYNVKIMTFIPRDRCGNIVSDYVTPFYKPPNPDFDCWRLNKFLVYTTNGLLIPCSNDLQEKEVYAFYGTSLENVEMLREFFRNDNRDGFPTICGRCEDSWTR